MVPQPLVRQVEVEFLKRVARLVERGKVDLPTAQAWGKELLSFLPFASLEDLTQKIKMFAANHPQLENLPLVIDHYLEKEKTQQTAAQMETLIKSQKAEEALQIAK